MLGADSSVIITTFHLVVMIGPMLRISSNRRRLSVSLLHGQNSPNAMRSCYLKTTNVACKKSDLTSCHAARRYSAQFVKILLLVDSLADRLTEILWVHLCSGSPSSNQRNVCMTDFTLLVELSVDEPATRHASWWFLHQSSLAVLGVHVRRHPESAHVCLCQFY